jgi:transposase-like protein
LKRKQHSASFKAKVALEALREKRTVNEIAGAHEIAPSMIFGWKKAAIAGLEQVFSSGTTKTRKDDDELVAQLYQQIGQLKVELDWLKKKL